MICNHCFSSIISEKHQEKCTTINMFEIITTNIKPDTKNMMTFGLAGCTAIIMVFFTQNTQIPYKIIFGHHPLKNEILKWYKSNYDFNFNIVTIIKSPGFYEKKVILNILY